MTYAILRSGSHQYRVTAGDIIQLESLPVEKGETLDLDHVLLLSSEAGVEVGTPLLTDVSVKARVLRNGRGRKLRVYKYKRRKGFAKTIGHRQDFTEVQITGIVKGGRDLAAV